MHCNENFGPGKTVLAYHFWSPEIGPGEPNLVAKIGLARPKMVRCRILIEFILPSAASGVRPHFRYKCASCS